MTCWSDFAWAVGVLEADGTIGPYGIAIMMKDKDVLIRAWEAFGVGNLTGPTTRDEMWRWKVANLEGMYSLIRRILPHLSARRTVQADRLIQRYELSRTPVPMICTQCGCYYERLRQAHKQKYCTPKCRSRAFKERQNDLLVA